MKNFIIFCNIKDNLKDKIRNEKFREKRSARSKTYYALKRGKLLEMPCIVCGDKAEAHHPDYSRPLDVVWLCHRHHAQTHAITLD